jgi:ribosomal-protein-alanine N-acetyltransferase
MTPPIINSPRLVVRFPARTEAASICHFMHDNEAYFAAWEPLKSQDYFTEHYWLQKIQQNNADFYAGTSCCFTLYGRDDDAIIGMVNYSTIVRGCFHSCFLGFKIGEAYQGQGLMTEAIMASLDYMFHTLNLHRVSANYMPRNHASARVLEKCEFQKDGIAKDYLYINGQWEDHVLMSMINKAWQE